MEYDNNMTGFLMINGDKKEPKHPDWKGSAEIAKVPFWAAAWMKVIEKGGNTGKKGMSIKLNPKDKNSSITGDLFLVKEGEIYQGSGEVDNVMYDCNATLGSVKKEGPNNGKPILKLNFFEKSTSGCSGYDAAPQEEDDEVPF